MPEPEVPVALRIPGRWTHPKDLLAALPARCRMTPESLFLPDGKEIGFGAVDADDQFAEIFRSSCRNPLTDEELKTVDNYTVNIFLSGPGGSLDAARTMMEAGAAIVRAGGAGVFIDNCGLAHGARAWLDMTDDGSPDAVSFAFVAIARSRTEVYTMGMHVLGLRDLTMSRADVERDGYDIVELIRYLAAGDKPVDDGHVIADLDGPRFRVSTIADTGEFAQGPFHNPFGRLKLISLRDIAEQN
jgi:hypothetical protein